MPYAKIKGLWGTSSLFIEIGWDYIAVTRTAHVPLALVLLVSDLGFKQRRYAYLLTVP